MIRTGISDGKRGETGNLCRQTGNGTGNGTGKGTAIERFFRQHPFLFRPVLVVFIAITQFEVHVQQFSSLFVH